MDRTLLVPLDGSPFSERVLPYARALARAGGTRLLLLRVLTPEGIRRPLVQEQDAREALEAVARPLRADGIAVEIEIRSTLLGSVAEAIVTAAHRHDVQSIVMVSHPRRGVTRWMQGGVAEEVLRRSARPVILVPSRSRRELVHRYPHRILAPMDGSSLSEHILEPLSSYALALDAEVVLLHVRPPETAEPRQRTGEENEAEARLQAAAMHLSQQGVRTEIRVGSGSPAEAILLAAHKGGVILIAMTTHGRGGVARLLLGSVASEVVQRSVVPVLLVRPAGLVPSGSASSRSVRLPASPPAAQTHALTILVALEVEEPPVQVLTHVARLARACSARVLLLNVFSPWVDMSHIVSQSAEERLAYASGERRLWLREQATLLDGVEVDARVEARKRGEEVDACIARVARESGADLVVVGSKHVSSVAGLILGSVAQGVLRLSPSPVLVVRSSVAEPQSDREEILAVAGRSP